MGSAIVRISSHGFFDMQLTKSRKKTLHIPSVVRKASVEYQRATDGEHLKFSDRQVENITRAFERIKGGCYGKLYLTKAEFCKIYDKIERRELDVIFRVFDIDKSNMLSVEQIIAGLGIMCRGSTQEKLRYYFKSYDLDQNGHLDKDEVTVMLEDLRQKCLLFQDCETSRSSSPDSGIGGKAQSEMSQVADDFVKNAFQIYDTDNDGRISSDEFSLMMARNRVGQKVTERLEYICNRILYSKINGPKTKTPQQRRKTSPALLHSQRRTEDGFAQNRRRFRTRRASAPAEFLRASFQKLPLHPDGFRHEFSRNKTLSCRVHEKAKGAS